jgi:hypothetical protein
MKRKDDGLFVGPTLGRNFPKIKEFFASVIQI